ncbi:MAG TPA: carboxypeptidase-like regulatory domain-containing protein [Gemmatimonadales bacterium]|nr:carboxypeptidase-like regulatory domain-containing protein [Gemmatimonadales bacterium]
MTPRGPLAALVLAATLLAPRLAHPQEPEHGAEPVIMELSVGRYGSRTVEALQVGRDVLLPLSVVAELAEIRCRRVPPASAELVIEPGARRALSDPATTDIRFGDTTLTLTPADRVIQAGEHYLSTRILGALLHTSFAVSWSDLSVTLLDADSLPVGRRRTRDRALAALRGGRGEATPDLALESERVRWDGMVLDYSALMPATDLLGGGAYSANLGLNVFGGSFEAALATAGPARGGPPRLDASWTGVWRTGRWISQARIGDGLATGPRPRSVRGFSLTNAPYLRQSFFDALPFAGALGPGWQIEAYRGGRLLALDSADALGRFSLDLPVEYGENPVDFVAYGPFGEVREFNRTYRVAGDALPASRFEYAMAAGQCRTPECTANANLDLRYGLSRRWSVRGGVDRFWRDTLPGLSHPYLGLSGSLGNAWGVNLEGVADAVVRTGLRYEPTDALRLTAEYDDFATGTVAPLLTPLGRRNQWTFTAFARPIPRRDDLYFDATLDRIADALGGSTSGRLGASLFTARMRISPAVRFTRAPAPVAADGAPRTALSLATFSMPYPELGPLLGAISTRTSWEVDFAGRIAAAAGYLSRPLGPSLRLETGAGWTRGAGTTFALYLSTQMPTVRSTTTVTSGAFGSGMTQFVQGSLLYDPASRGVAFTSGPSVERAGLSGRVFLDQNGDGRWNPGETLLAGVRLRAGYVTAVSDSAGRYRVWDLPSFEPVLVAVDSATLASPLWVPTHGSVSVETGPNRFRELDLPILPGGVIEGRVLRDTPTGQQPVAGARLLLRRRGTDEVRALTSFSDGAFYLMGVKPGEYELRLDPSDLERLGLGDTAVPLTMPADPDGATVGGLEVRLR